MITIDTVWNEIQSTVDMMKGNDMKHGTCYIPFKTEYSKDIHDMMNELQARGSFQKYVISCEDIMAGSPGSQIPVCSIEVEW